MLAIFLAVLHAAPLLELNTWGAPWEPSFHAELLELINRKLPKERRVY